MGLPLPKESDLVRQCLEYLALADILAWRQNAGSVVGSHRGKKRFVRFCGIDGVSDIVGCFHGLLLCVECKRPGNEPTPNQQAFLEKVRMKGGLAACVHSLDELRDALESWREVAR